MIVKRISAALRYEHAAITAAIKQIGKITGIEDNTASRWYAGKYAPKSRHLLMLSAHFPQMLQAVCELMVMSAVWQEAVRMGVVEMMRGRLDEKYKNWKKPSSEVDNFVHIRVRVDARKAGQLNQRQLWFLGEVQHGRKMYARDLVRTWHVHAKTAGRDVKGLLKAELIRPVNRCRACWYEES